MRSKKYLPQAAQWKIIKSLQGSFHVVTDATLAMVNSHFGHGKQPLCGASFSSGSETCLSGLYTEGSQQPWIQNVSSNGDNPEKGDLPREN